MPQAHPSSTGPQAKTPFRAAVFARNSIAARTARLAVGGAGPVEIDTYRWTEDCIAAVARQELGLVVVDAESIGGDAKPFAAAVRAAAKAGLWLVLIGGARAADEIKQLIEAGYDAVLPLGEAGSRLTRFIVEAGIAPQVAPAGFRGR